MAFKIKYKILLLTAFSVAFAGIYLFYFSGSTFSDAFQNGTISHQIAFDLRLPRLLFVLMIGGTLSVLGGCYQVLFRNPLAEPYLLGISSGVSLMAAIMHVGFQMPLNSWSMIGVGCGSAFAISVLLLSLGRLAKGSSTERLVLFGMSLNFVLSSLLFLYLTFASQQLGGGSMQWLFGHIPWVTLEEGVYYFVTGLVFVALWFVMGRQLDAMAMGDTVARTLGVSPVLTRRVVILTSSLFLGLVVVQTGSIGFVGLVIPHCVRLIFSPHSSRSLFLFSFAGGGVFLLFCDFLSRNLLPPMEFPIGIITTLVGSPIFLWLLWKR